MSETDKSAVDLFIQGQRDINAIRDDVSKLIKEDLGLTHKMDLVMTEQRLLKERLEEGVSKTAYKTYEMVGQLVSQFQQSAKDNALKFREMEIDNVARDKDIKRNNDINMWIVRGFIISVAAGVSVGILLRLWKF